MEYMMVLLAIALVVFIIIGAALGFASMIQTRNLRRTLTTLEVRLRAFEKRLSSPARDSQRPAPVPTPEKPEEPEPVFSDSPEPEGPTPPAEKKVVTPAAPPTLPPLPARPAPLRTKKESASLELALGEKWMGWVGVVLFVIGIGFGLKYVYDRQWLPPEFRLALAALAGLAAIAAGEYVRRKDRAALFQTLTGGGIATLYLCVYFSYGVYELTGPTVSLILGVIVSTLGVVMAVAHNALPIAVLAVLGGFLSPLLFSTGENRPYAFFSYIAVLDLVALGAAYYRRWRALDLLCFAGTALLYQLWFNERYETENLAAGIVFTSLFYLMFLLIPTINSLARRTAMPTEALSLVIINALYSLYAYYELLYADYRMAMGFVVIAQAALVFLVFRSWSTRVSSTDQTAESLLIIALALVTLAIPIQLKLYGIPIAWGVEGALFVYLGIRYTRRTCTYGGLAALLLATTGLLYRLPLHSLPFTPVINAPFGSWVLVITTIVIAATLLYRAKSDDHNPSLKILAAATGLAAYLLLCLLATLETQSYWAEHKPDQYRQSMFVSLILLWTIIPVATEWILARRTQDVRILSLAWAGFAVGALFALAGFDRYSGDAAWLFADTQFVATALLIAAAWWAAHRSRERGDDLPANILEGASQFVLMLLLGMEFNRWGHTDALSIDLARALLSVAWALQAFALVGAGLVRRQRHRRILGFILFAFTVAHVVFVALDAGLDPGLQIISFIGSGLLLLAAAAAYSRFRKQFLDEEESDEIDTTD